MYPGRSCQKFAIQLLQILQSTLQQGKQQQPVALKAAGANSGPVKVPWADFCAEPHQGRLLKHQSRPWIAVPRPGVLRGWIPLLPHPGRSPGALRTLGARCPHPEIPSPVESPGVAAAAADPAIPRPQAPAQRRQQLGGHLPALVVDVPHHDVPAACNNRKQIKQGCWATAMDGGVTLRAPGLGTDVKLCLWKHPERDASTAAPCGTWEMMIYCWGKCWYLINLHLKGKLNDLQRHQLKLLLVLF